MFLRFPRMAHLQTESTPTGPISTRSQATQTLLVQTQIPTQLLSHEVHQYTQLINHDSVEHVGGDTLVNDSDPEGSGNTIVLHEDDADDDDDDDAHGDAESGPPARGKAGPSLQGQRDDDSHATPPYEVKNGSGKTRLHVEVHEAAPSKLINDSAVPRIQRNLPHSDSTTEEEGDNESVGYLVADAESQPPHVNVISDNKGVHLGEKNGLPDVVTSQGNFSSQNTPEASVVADMTGKKSSQSRRPSIASVRAESLHASGLRAASRGASIGSEGKDDGNFDSVVATLGLTDGMLNGEPKKPFEAPEAQLENPGASKAADIDSVQLSPKTTLPFDGITVRAPCMSTSRLNSKAASLGRASQQYASEQECIDSTELNTSHLGRVKSCTDHPEDLSAPLELPSLGLRRLRSQASIVSPKKLKQVDGANDVNVKVQPRQPSNQKARKLVFDIIDASPTDLTNRLEDGGSADPKALGSKHDYALKNGIDAPVRERQSSLPSGICAASANLSYLESQEPGEESQANALNVVDKLVWFDTTCISDDVVTSPVPQDSSLKGLAGSKGRQSLAQAAQMKTVQEKLDVFDWEDSQVDEEVFPDTKQVPASTKAQKRNLEDLDKMSDRRRQVAPQQQKSKTILCLDKTGDDQGKEKSRTPDVRKSEVSNVEPSSSNHELKPHTLLTTRLRNRIKAESRPSAKGRKTPGSKSEPMKRACKEKQIDKAVKEFELGQRKVCDNKVQRGHHSITCDPSNEAGEKEVLGKELESDQKNKKGRKARQADSLSAKKNSESFKTFEVGPSIQGHLAVPVRTSQDDAAADLWIEAFTNTKSSTHTGNAVEAIKFRKRSDLLEHMREDSKRRRTTETATVSFNEDNQDIAKKEEASTRENILKPQLPVQQAPEELNAAAISQSKGRRAGTLLSQKENQIEKKEDEVEEQSIIKTKQNSKKPRLADAPKVSQVKGRRVGTRSSQGEYQEALKAEEKAMQEDKAEGEPKTRQGQKEYRTADEALTVSVKSRGASTCASAAEHIEVGNAREDDMPERGSKTRSSVQDVTSIAVVARNVKEGIRPMKAAIKSRTTKATTDDMDETPLSRAAMQAADFDTNKPHIKTSSSKKIEQSQSHQHFTTRDAQEVEANAWKVGSSGLLPSFLVTDGSIGTLAGRPKKRKRRGDSSDVIVSESTEDGGNAGSLLKDQDKDKFLPKIKDPMRKQGDVSSTILTRRTRSSLSDGGSQKTDFIGAGKTTIQIQSDPTNDNQALQKHINSLDAKKGVTKQVAKLVTNDLVCEQGGVSSTILLRRTRSSLPDGESQKNDSLDAGKTTTQIHGDPVADKQFLQMPINSSDAKKGLTKQVAKSATKATTKSISLQNKKRQSLELLTSFNLIDEGRRRKRESGCIRVLFSHSLTEETIKHQKKILAKLGGQLAVSASDCTHFVSNGFTRSQNMLISMAAGKEVVTTLWLENCGQAHYFVDEKTYIPQDAKKEKELGFSMVTSLASARRKPLLKGVSVLISPNTVPEPAVMKAIVECAGGQVVDIKSWSSHLGKKESDTPFTLVANEKDFDFCVQFLNKGLKVHSEELLLHGIVTQTLDFSRHRLFENFNEQKGPRRGARID